MKTYAYIICFISLVACKGKTHQSNTLSVSKDIRKTITKGSLAPVKVIDSTFKPFKLVDEYTVVDTGYFDFGLGNGTYAVIKRDNKLIDTIDYVYKFQKVSNNQFAYFKIEGKGPLSADNSEIVKKNSIDANIGDYMLVNTNGIKTNVSQLAPNFGWFASPSIVNGAVYYWQVKKFKEQYSISAARFDPKTDKIVSQCLFNDDIDTDDGGYFQQAEGKNGSVVFTSPKGKEYVFSSDFKLINNVRHK